MRRAAAALLPLLAPVLLAQSYVAGPQILTFFSEVDDSDQPYGVYLPREFDASRKYPLVISLHGAYSNHRLNLRRVFGKGNRPGESDGEASRYFPPLPAVDYIVATPFARGTMGYQGIPERDVYDVLADVKSRLPIDEDRVYLTGLSMGGGGTLWLGLTRPDLWAAIAPVCPAPPPETEDFLPNALNLPVHLFHGAMDPVVPPEVSRDWHKKLLHLDSRVEYIEYPGVRHNSWDHAYRDAGIFEWFSQFQRNRFPERVRFTSRYYKYRTSYWVELDGLVPGELASIDARFTGENQIEVRTEKLDGFTLRLEGHPKFTAGKPLRVTVDGAALKTGRGETLSFSRSEKGWRSGPHVIPPGDKRPGLEGPIREAISGRHLYVYGTKDSPDGEELRRRREQAEYAADWQGGGRRLSLAFRTIADKDVTEADLRGTNLVLFGTKETNHLIERFAGSAPVELNPGAADYSLVFIVPAGDRYILVNSGLPWWTGGEDTRRGILRLFPSPFSLLMTFGDFILFKGSLKNVVAQGSFSREWKVPPEPAAAMKATGAVEIR